VSHELADGGQLAALAQEGRGEHVPHIVEDHRASANKRCLKASSAQALACLETGRRFIGVDLSPDHATLAADRIRKSKAALREGTEEKGGVPNNVQIRANSRAALPLSIPPRRLAPLAGGGQFHVGRRGAFSSTPG
jgi:hypothetical protein